MKNLLIIFVLFFSMLQARAVKLNLPERSDSSNARKIENKIGYIGDIYLPESLVPNGYLLNPNYEKSNYYVPSPIKTKLSSKYPTSYSRYQIGYETELYRNNVVASNIMQQRIKACLRRKSGKCRVLNYGDEAFLGRNSAYDVSSNSLQILVRKGRLVCSIFMFGRSANNNHNRDIVYQAPSNNDLIQEGLKWYKAFLRYCVAKNWKISITVKSPKLKLTPPNTTKPILAGTGIVEPIPKEKPLDPCQDPDFKNDPDWKQHCVNKRYNETLKKEEQEAKDKRIQAEIKAEKEYQAKLAKYNEEERQINLKVIQENEKGNKRREAIEKQENQAFHDSIAKDMQERKEFQAKQQRNLKLINRFASGDEWSDAYHNIKEIDKTGDMKKSEKLYSEHKKTYYNSWRERQMKESEVLNKRVEKFDKASNNAEFIRDTSLTINKVIAKLDPTGIGDKIVEIQENIGNLIDAAEKGGVEGVIVKSTSIVTNKFTKDIGGDIIEKTHKQIKDYNENGIKLDKSDKIYDKDGNRLTRYKKGDRAYNKNKEEISFSTGRRALSNIFFDVADGKNPIKKTEDAIKNIKDGVAEGDFNKAVNAGLDLSDAKESIDGGTDKAVKKLEGL